VLRRDRLSLPYSEDDDEVDDDDDNATMIIIITPWIGVHLEKLTLAQLLKIFSAFIKDTGILGNLMECFRGFPQSLPEYLEIISVSPSSPSQMPVHSQFTIVFHI
jgi:hypothetical protein